MEIVIMRPHASVNNITLIVKYTMNEVGNWKIVNKFGGTKNVSYTELSDCFSKLFDYFKDNEWRNIHEGSSENFATIAILCTALIGLECEKATFLQVLLIMKLRRKSQ